MPKKTSENIKRMQLLRIGEGMKLTPELLQQIVDDYEIQNHYCPFTDADVIQVKMACSIYNQAPADNAATTDWLIDHADDLNISYSQLAVKCKDGTYSYYDYKETDDVLRMALHYKVELTEWRGAWMGVKHGNPTKSHISQNPALAIMGCIAQLEEKEHAYAS